MLADSHHETETIHIIGNHDKLNQTVFNSSFKKTKINNCPTTVKLKLEKELYVTGRTKQQKKAYPSNPVGISKNLIFFLELSHKSSIFAFIKENI